MVKKLKSGQYSKAAEIQNDLNQMMINCRTYNAHIDILRTAEKFENSIKTEWFNFEKMIRGRGISLDTPINITEDVLKNLEMIEEKNTNRKPNTLQTVLG